MNCHEAEPHLYSERDGALEPSQRAGLDAHLAGCAACRRIRETLALALGRWGVQARDAQVPDVEREWLAVRRRIRGGSESGATGGSRTKWGSFGWVVLPVGAAAAAALALFVSRPTSVNPEPSQAVAHIARANSVEAPGNNASTMVFVDEKSGWLIVWASDANPKSG